MLQDIQNNIPVSFLVTLGQSSKQKTWDDKRIITWSELSQNFTDHRVGEKDGHCFVPGVFTGKKRTKNQAKEIGLLVLDCDTGETLDQIQQSLQKMSWAGIIYSTHSHLTNVMEVSEKAYNDKGYTNPSDYLINKKGMQDAVAHGSIITKSHDPNKLIIQHNPCPKFRVIIPLASPWRASDFPSQDVANSLWKNFVISAAKSLGLHHDQSCVDSSRLYYLPRHPKNHEFITSIINGNAIDSSTFFDFYQLEDYEAVQQNPDNKTPRQELIYLNTENGIKFDLVKWAAKHADSFDVVSLLKTKKPDVLTGYVVDGYKHHISCVNHGMHTKQEPDNATFIVSPQHSTSNSFVYHCMHAHCCNEDRLYFIKRMLEEGWLTVEDLGENADTFCMNYDDLKSLCEDLNNNSSPDDIKKTLDEMAGANLDPIHNDFLFDTIKKKTGSNLSTLKKSLKTVKEGKSVDLAYFIAQKTLDTYFNGGSHLIRAEDKSFWRYTGQYWTPIRNEQVEHYILIMVKKYAHDEEYRKTLKNALDLLISRQSADIYFFRNLGETPSVINFRNGELWIQDNGNVILKPHCPESYLQYVLEFDYIPEATCPRFDNALFETFSNSSNPQDMVRHLQEVMGYFIQPSRFLTCWFMWQGGGSNGKTTLFETLERLMSRSSIYSERISTLEKNRFALGSMMGKSLFVDDDVSEGTKLPDGLLKKLSERKLITGEKKFKDTFEYVSSVAVLLLCNNNPLCDDLSYGTRRRVKIIPFSRKFEGNDKDASLYPYIWKHEMSGVLNRLVNGLKRLKERGDFFEPEDCIQAKDEWLINANPFNAFIEDCFNQNPNKYVSLQDIYTRYNSWKFENGFNKSMSRQALKNTLKTLGFDNNKIGGCIRIYGLELF